MNCHDALSRIKAGKSGYNGEDADSNVVSIHFRTCQILIIRIGFNIKILIINLPF